MDLLDRIDRPDPSYRGERPGETRRADRSQRAAGTDRAGRESRGDAAREPIYAGLVTEWRAQGRTVPAEPEAQGAVPPGFVPRARSVAERI
ncbi:hypothetical protein GQF42_05445 [Streptomyces broussonetiae]|uniref:Uncharacterized protein n=2 Tax=Streptomyces broussonetiae TaxID=2686304 RepID=A0A6I6MX44_9ACTN|nr:hypothetical protein [Streptomyces broussonetiae]QHA02799.1 hypothetical protein GQF42_05445 [Streptomyces broussonetiae]